MKDNKISELEKLIKYHKAKYYSGSPKINDNEYDLLEQELRTLDADNYVLSIVGSETKSNDKVKHSSKMLSLNKTYNLNDLQRWIGNEDVVSLFKIDGVSCSLIYEYGVLKTAKTRGDGSFGENITSKIMWMDSIPKKIPDTHKLVEIRGELFCDEKSFFELSEVMSSRGMERPTSQRNIVAGLVSRKENIELCQYIRFKAFDYISDNNIFKTEIEKHRHIENQDFDVLDIKLHENSVDVENTLDETRKFISDGDYQIDGLVFSYNNLFLHEELGETAHHPRYKMAFKFQGESKRSKIKNITWSVSRNGVLTPIGNIEPVELSGAKISRVTLHNFGLVNAYKLRNGDTIEIIRSGEVIPKFLSVDVSLRPNVEFSYPVQCPSCNEEVRISDIRLICDNELCPGRIKESILNFIQKIGIDDLSSKRLDELIKSGLVKKIEDLYSLTLEDFLKLDKVKEKLASKLFSSIEKSKKADLITFLSSLGISGGAYNKCEKVVRSGYNSLEGVKNLTVEKLKSIDSFAEKSATEFHKSLKQKMGLIDKLNGVGFEFDLKDEIETFLTGKKVCITGSLSKKRSVIENQIRDAGGVIVSTVTKNTNFLLTNEKEAKSSKFKKALDLGIDIFSETELEVRLKKI